MALRAGEGERLDQGGHRGGLVAAGLVRWGLQRAYLDNAADAARVAAWASSRSSNARAWPGRSCTSSTRASTRYSRSLRVARFVVRAEAALLGPAGSRGVSPWASSSRARCAGTGLERHMTAGLGARWRPRRVRLPCVALVQYGRTLLPGGT